MKSLLSHYGPSGLVEMSLALLGLMLVLAWFAFFADPTLVYPYADAYY